MLIKNKFLFLIILVLALTSVSMVSAQDPSTNVTAGNVVDCVSDLNHFEVDDISSTQESNDSISKNSCLNNQNNNVIKEENGEKSFKDLQSTINSSSDNSVLDLNCDYKYTQSGNFNGITISKNNFTIDGHGHTIDANPGSDSVRIFTISGNNVTLKNLILINANFRGDGATIYNTGSLVYINNCSFSNNKAGYGGVIYNSGVNLTVSNNTFIKNKATNYGGVIFNDKDGDFVTLNNNIFINNTADNGGAIRNYGVNLTVANNIFINNTAEDGGAIYNSGENLKVSTNIFINNTAENGGAIFNYAYDFVVVNDNWWGNNTPNWDKLISATVTPGSYAVLNLTSETSNNNVVYVNFYKNGTTEIVPISRVFTLTIAGNTTTEEIVNGNFSEIYISPKGSYNITVVVDNEKQTICLANTTTTKPFTDLKKAIDSANGTLTLNSNYKMAVEESDTFKNGITISKDIVINGDGFIIDANKLGRIFIIKNGTVTLANVTLINGTNAGGGAIYNEAANFTISNCIFINNTASSSGGAISNVAMNVTINNCTFINNTAGEGGVIYNTGVNLTVCNNSFIKNSASGKGGVIYNTDVNLTVCNNVFINNTAGEGGVIYNTGVNLTVCNNDFISNAASDGGVIYNYYGAGLNVCNNNFTTNKAGNCGGVIYDYSVNSSVSNNIFISNSASFQGGVIYQLSKNLMLCNNIFINNKASSAGIITNRGSVVIRDNWWGTNNPNWSNLIYKTVAQDYAVLNLTCSGGVVCVNFYRNGTTEVLPFSRDVILKIGDNITADEIVNGTFKRNYTAPEGNYEVSVSVDNQKLTCYMVIDVYVDSVNGKDTNNGVDWSNAVKTIDNALGIVLANGRIHLADGVYGVESQITIGKTVMVIGNGSKTFITNNGNGKGVFKVTTSNVGIYNCTFINNTAGDGGVIYNGGVNLTVCSNNFINNSASGKGGVIYNAGVNLTVCNNSFINNSAGEGGVIYNTDVNLTVCNNDFISNTASNGGVIYNYYGAGLNVCNNNFTTNKAGNCGGVIYDYSVNSTVCNNIFISNSASFQGGVIYQLSKNLMLCNNIFINNKASSAGIITNRGSVVIKDNWWGTNNPNWGNLIYKTVAQDYAVLNLTCSGGVVCVNFYRNGTTEVLPFSRDVILKIGDNITADEIVNGTFKRNYTVPEGNYEVSVSVDNQKLTCYMVIDVYVDPVNGKDTNNGVDWSNAVKTIDNALGIVLANGRIHLADGVYGVESQITIGKTVMVIGNGSKTFLTNNGNGKGVFKVTTSNVGIYNCTFINNTAGEGGVIYNTGANLTMCNNDFINNTAGDGGVIYNYYGAGLNVCNNNFTLNKASNCGGVIYNRGVDSSVSNNIFISNSADFHGGVIYNLAKNLMVYNNIFINNKAQSAAVISNYQGSVVIKDNWWGSNNPNWGNLIYNVVTQDYAVLNLTCSGSVVCVNFYRNGTTEVLPFSRDVILKIGDNITADEIVNGTFKRNYTAPEGNYEVSVSVDNQKLTCYMVIDIYVDPVNGKDTNNGVDWSNAVKTIGHAMKIVSVGGTIHLADGTHIVNTQIDINKTVTISGNTTKALITDNGNGVFKVTADGVNIQSCTFINNTAEYGRTIENYAKNLIISNNVFTADECTVIYNSAESTINLTNNKYSGDKTYIYNLGTIITPTIITVLGNGTINTSYGENVVLYATITTEDGGSVTGQTLTFNINNTSYNATNDNGNYTNTSYIVDFVGIKTVNVNYNGTTNLIVKTATINSSKIAAKVDIEVDDSINYGENATIKINVTKGATGNVTITIDGNKYTIVNLTNSEANLNIVGLSAEKHTITVKYNGNDLYATSSNDATVNVNSVAPTINIDASGMVYGETGTITVTVNKYLNGTVPTGNVSISVGTIEEIVKLVNGVANLTVSGLTAGQHTVDVIYNGDKNYTSNSNSTLINVGEVSSEVDITVGKVVYGEDAVVRVNVTSGASGNVTVRVDGKEYKIIDLINSEATLNITGLSAGEHKINVTYNGDNNHNASSKEVMVNVDQATPTISIGISGFVCGENGTVTVTVKEYLNGVVPSGNVTVSVNGNKQNITLREGVASLTVLDLTAGEYNISVIYNGDKNYTSNSNSTLINVGEVSSEVDITVGKVVYGEDAVVRVNVTSGASGNVTVYVDGEEYKIIDLINSEATLNIAGLSAGEHKINVTYNGDNNHNDSSKEVMVNVDQATPTISISTSGFVYGEDGTVTVAVNRYLDGVVPSGNVTISVDGESKNINLENGVAILPVSGLTAGQYTVDVIYNGDKNYTSNSNSTLINVGEASSEVDITVGKVVYGEDAVVRVNVTSGASGNVTVYVDGKEYKIIDLTNSRAALNIAGLSAGEHKINVTYNGDNNHNISSNEVTVNVDQAIPTININATNMVYGETGTVIVTVKEYLNGAVPSGNVTISVNGKKQNITLRDGVATLLVSGLTAGEYKINVTYNGDKNYTTNFNSTLVNVDGVSSEVNIAVDGVVYGEDAVVRVNVTSGASGNVTVYVDGKEYKIVDLTNSRATLNIAGLSAGQHKINVAYNGDNNHNTSSNEVTVNVDQAIPTININATNMVYGKEGTITVSVNKYLNGTVPSGNVTISVDGESKSINLENGVAILPVSGLTAGEHKINVTYNGDKNYTSNSNSTSFNVDKASSKVDVNVNNVVYGENATVKVNVTPGATGNVTIIIDNKKYDSIKLNNSEATLTVSNLTAGEHKINVTYNGDNNYNKSENTASFDIAKANPNIEIKVIGDVNSTDNIPVSVILPDDATGYVNITVGDKKYINQAIVNGTVNITVDYLDYGIYNITASYIGDSNYNSSIANATVFVPKADDYQMNITINPTKPNLGDDVVVYVNLSKNATGKVIITVDGKNYTVNIRDGVANITIADIGAGKHNITANYSGDNQYIAKNTNCSFNVNKEDANLVVKINNIKAGEAINITATLTGINNTKLNGLVNVAVNNKTYTIVVIDGVGSKIGDVFNKSGINNFIANWSGDENYDSTGDYGVFEVSKVTDYSMNVTVPEDGENTTVIVDLPDDATGNVTVIVNGKNYTVPVKNGTANITIPNLPGGDYNITINYTGDGKYEPAITNKTITVTSGGVNLTAGDVVMIYKDGSRLYATLLDSKGNPIANATLSFTINGITYNRTTNENGIASIAINLETGKYNATISYGENNTVNATVLIKTSITANDIVKMYQNDTQFYAVFLGTDGNPLANTNVTFNINGVFYTRTTDENGTVKLNINLRPGSYILTAYNPVNGEQRGFNVLVKSLIEASDLTKYYLNTSRFEAKIYSKDGSLAVNKTVTFNINGVFYTRTSDVNGIVSLAISLRPGNYIITSNYGGLSIGNNVKVLSTLEASDLVMKFKDGSAFKARALDGQGNPLANQTITFNVNGVFYQRTTDSNGIAKLNINLMKGKYIITSYWDGYETGNKIEVL